MKLTPDDLIMCLKFRHVRTMKDITYFYSGVVSTRTLYRLIRKARLQHKLRINKSTWPHEYHSIV